MVILYQSSGSSSKISSSSRGALNSKIRMFSSSLFFNLFGLRVGRKRKEFVVKNPIFVLELSLIIGGDVVNGFQGEVREYGEPYKPNLFQILSEEYSLPYLPKVL